MNLLRYNPLHPKGGVPVEVIRAQEAWRRSHLTLTLFAISGCSGHAVGDTYCPPRERASVSACAVTTQQRASDTSYIHTDTASSTGTNFPSHMHGEVARRCVERRGTMAGHLPRLSIIICQYTFYFKQ